MIVPAPADPTCPICSKPVTSGSLAVLQHGELIHLRCRTRTLELAAMEDVARARATRTLATKLRAETKRRRADLKQAARLIESIKRERAAGDQSGRAAGPWSQDGVCPVCRHPATVTDWRPRINWIVVEACSCRGFFLRAGLVEERLTKLSVVDRLDLALRIRKFRAMGHEAWCTTTDGTAHGPLVVRTARPDRPA